MSLQGYFDYNATTPMCQQAIDALFGVIHNFGNPSSKYSLSNISKQRLENARRQVAQLVGCNSSEITFTSGGTEANNWAIKGVLTSCYSIAHSQPAHIIVSSIEHSSVLEIASYLERVFSIEVTRINPNAEGMVSAKAIEAALRPNTQLVSIMLVNNEVGTIQPIREISTLLQARGIHFHVDGVQAIGKICVNAHELGVDSMSFAAHKFYGPKGVGGLYIKHGITIEPLLHGGGQEDGLRGGTEAVALIVAMGAAAEAINAALPELVFRATNYRTTFSRLLIECIPGVSFHQPSDPNQQVPYTLSVCIDGIRAEALAAILDEMHGIQVSLGSACANNKTVSLSHVLVAMGLSERAIKATFRVSFGQYTEEQDLKHFAEVMAQGVRSLQRISKAIDNEQTTSA
ncbi:cysteine desulfurase family protein [Deefgea rivuli]|uniref:cysteine desulfurase family protein n=1 Tax=Deefgea rivuli TaxID=400948 RepID=UPI0004877015|nr:cysteine desulfurase family protein [Deefgea rivuli]